MVRRADVGGQSASVKHLLIVFQIESPDITYCAENIAYLEFL